MNAEKTKSSGCFPYDPVMNDIKEPLLDNPYELCGTTRRHIVWETFYKVERIRPEMNKRVLFDKARKYNGFVDYALNDRKVGLSEFPKPKYNFIKSWNDPFILPWLSAVAGKECVSILTKKEPLKNDIEKLKTRIEAIQTKISEKGSAELAKELADLAGETYVLGIERVLDSGKAIIFLVGFLEYAQIRWSSSQAGKS